MTDVPKLREELDELPPEVVVLPAEWFGGEWRFRLATDVYVDGCGGPCESGLLEGDFREALAEQGYDAAAISLAVVEAPDRVRCNV